MEKKYAFRLSDLKLPRILFQINPDWEDPEGKVPLNTSIDIEHHIEDKQLSVMVRLRSKDNKHTPFSFIIEAVGLFTFDEPISEKDAEGVANINCAAIIFPYVREAAADVIRRAGFPTFNHKPVNFQKFFEEKKIEQTKRKAAKQVKPKMKSKAQTKTTKPESKKVEKG